jgi:hypothetical protein
VPQEQEQKRAQRKGEDAAPTAPAETSSAKTTSKG